VNSIRHIAIKFSKIINPEKSTQWHFKGFEACDSNSLEPDRNQFAAFRHRSEDRALSLCLAFIAAQHIQNLAKIDENCILTSHYTDPPLGGSPASKLHALLSKSTGSAPTWFKDLLDKRPNENQVLNTPTKKFKKFKKFISQSAPRKQSSRNFTITVSSKFSEHFSIHLLDSDTNEIVKQGVTLENLFKDLASQASWDGDYLWAQLLHNIQKEGYITDNYPSLLTTWKKKLTKLKRWKKVEVLAANPIHINEIYKSIRLSHITLDYAKRGVSSISTVIDRTLHKQDLNLHWLGDSGCGKTTLGKWTTRYIFLEKKRPTILIILSQYINELTTNPKLSLLDFFIQDCCELAKKDPTYKRKKQELSAYLDQQKSCFLVIDGWDKMSESVEEKVSKELKRFPFSETQKIIISRPLKSSGLGTENFVKPYRIRPLTVRQSVDFLMFTLKLNQSYSKKDIAEKLASTFPHVSYFTPFFLIIFKEIFHSLFNERYNFAKILEMSISKIHSDNEESILKEMEDIAFQLSFNDSQKTPYFNTQNKHIVLSRLVSHRTFAVGSNKIYSKDNYFFIHPIIHSYFAASKLVNEPDLLKEKLKSHGLLPDRAEGWILMSGMLYNDSKLKRSSEVFWEFWKKQIHTPDEFKTVYALVAHFINQQGTPDKIEKLLGLDLKKELFDLIKKGINLETNVRAYIALSDKFMLKNQLRGRIQESIKKQVLQIINDLDTDIEPDDLDKIERKFVNGHEEDFTELAGDLISFSSSQTTVQQSEVSKIIEGFKTYSPNKKFSEVPPLLLDAILANNNPEIVRNCLEALTNYSINTDADKLAEQYHTQTDEEIKKQIARIISNCRNLNAYRIILRKSINSDLDTPLLEIISSGHLFFDSNTARFCTKKILSTELSTKDLTTFLALFNKCRGFSLKNEQLKINYFVKDRLESLLTKNTKGLVEAIETNIKHSPSTKREMFNILEKIISQDSLDNKARIRACQLLPSCWNEHIDITFLSQTLKMQSTNKSLSTAIIQSLIKISPLTVVRIYLQDPECEISKTELLQWSEVENIRIYEDHVYLANGKIIEV